MFSHFHLCKLYSVEEEDRDHLFYGCLFSQQIWQGILQLCGVRRPVTDWHRELRWAMERFKGKALLSVILRLAWRVFIYNIWKERKAWIFGSTSQNPLQILENIQTEVRIRILGLQNIADDVVNRNLCTSWGLHYFT
ncbi:hypothetical protein PTKIN_Ptkin17bG0015600 [Pterospermum kingtungense]